MIEKELLSRNKAKKIYYISPYMPNDIYDEFISPATQNKVNYIRSLIDENQLITVCVNCSLNVKNTIIRRKEIKGTTGVYKVLLSVCCNKKPILPFCVLIMLLEITRFIVFNVKKNDVIILYHSIFYDWIIQLLKKLKKFKLIYEVEEIYADVRTKGYGREKEINQCQKATDGYIFPTELLDKLINKENKPSLIIYGSYKVNDNSKKSYETNKTIIVYSGTLANGKGVTEVIESAKYLDEKFEIRIIGFGNKQEVENVNKLISQNSSKCKVSFDGLKYGKDYDIYLSKCEIGLCIQPEANLFNSTSFPSKILSYLGSHLNIVASRIPAVLESQIAQYICFTKSSKPKDIAEAIKQISNKKYVDVSILKKLDEEAKLEMNKMINKVISI